MHTPEFEFEKSIDNVREAAEENDLGWLIVQDNDYKTWRYFTNRYWPAKYIFDPEGNLRFQHFGEGKYAETEQVLKAATDRGGVRCHGDRTDVFVAVAVAQRCGRCLTDDW